MSGNSLSLPLSLCACACADMHVDKCMHAHIYKELLSQQVEMLEVLVILKCFLSQPDLPIWLQRFSWWFMQSYVKMRRKNQMICCLYSHFDKTIVVVLLTFLSFLIFIRKQQLDWEINKCLKYRHQQMMKASNYFIWDQMPPIWITRVN